MTDDMEKTIFEPVVLSSHAEQCEPDFVKLYLNTVLALKDLPLSHNRVLNAILSRMSYADASDGGQVVVLNQYHKEGISKEVGKTKGSIESAITMFVNSGILKRVGRATYQVNPNLFGKGDWKAIKGIRANFEFGDTTEETEL